MKTTEGKIEKLKQSTQPLGVKLQMIREEVQKKLGKKRGPK